MQTTSRQLLRTYLVLTTLSTLASSFIWGINTLFLLDAGLSITQAFAANSFFTLGQVIFEVPTGVVADTVGRRASFLLGSVTLLISTVIYLLLWQMGAPFWGWALTSIMLGLGFTFFSGATEAWLVDGLHATGYKKGLETAFAKGQIATGAAMLIGTVSGGLIAQVTNLGVPYILRAGVLGITFVVALVLMRDVGFSPRRSASVAKEARTILKASLKYGFGNPSVRWLMLAAPFTAGVSFYAFYAMQPYLLELYGRSESYAIAGLAAAIVAGAQIAGGLLVPYIRRLFAYRTTVLLVGGVFSAAALFLIGLAPSFWVALGLLIIWAMVFAATLPVRLAYINGLIPSAQRATVISSDNLLGSTGGVVIQPGLGKVADVWGYPASYVAGAALQPIAILFTWFAKRTHAKSDPIERGKEPSPPPGIPAAAD